jgi:hypothetical protein
LASRTISQGVWFQGRLGWAEPRLRPARPGSNPAEISWPLWNGVGTERRSLRDRACSRRSGSDRRFRPRRTMTSPVDVPGFRDGGEPRGDKCAPISAGPSVAYGTLWRSTVATWREPPGLCQRELRFIPSAIAHRIVLVAVARSDSAIPFFSARSLNRGGRQRLLVSNTPTYANPYRIPLAAALDDRLKRKSPRGDCPRGDSKGRSCRHRQRNDPAAIPVTTGLQ